MLHLDFFLLCFAWELGKNMLNYHEKIVKMQKIVMILKQEFLISFFWYGFLSYRINDVNLCGHICRETQDFSVSSSPLLVTITVSLPLSPPPFPTISRDYVLTEAVCGSSNWTESSTEITQWGGGGGGTATEEDEDKNEVICSCP